MTSTFFQRILILVFLAGSIAGLHAQEYKYEIGGMAGGAFYMGDVNKNAFFKGQECRGMRFVQAGQMQLCYQYGFRYPELFMRAVKETLSRGQIHCRGE